MKRNKPKYDVGDLVQLNAIWDHKIAIIIETSSDEDGYKKVYKCVIQGHDVAGWLSEITIAKKI